MYLRTYVLIVQLGAETPFEPTAPEVARCGAAEESGTLNWDLVNQWGPTLIKATVQVVSTLFS